MHPPHKPYVGLEPTTLRLEVLRAIQLRHTDDISGVGFEPTKHMQQILSLSPLTARES